MSFSNPEEEQGAFHPCKVWIEYKSKAMDFQYWDKEAIGEEGEAGAKMSLGPNPKFIFIDHTFCVSGWNGAKKFGLKSNELKITATKESWANSIFKVESMPKEAMTINIGGGQSLNSIDGSWADIKDLVVSQKGKLTINVYVAIKINKELVLGCLQLSGSAFGPFKDFYDKNKGPAIHSKVIAVTGHDSKTTGDNTFNVPVFEFTKSEVKEETYDTCIEIDKALQTYMKGRLAAAPAEIEEPKADIPATPDPMKVVHHDDPQTQAGNTPPPPTDEPHFDDPEDPEEEAF